MGPGGEMGKSSRSLGGLEAGLPRGGWVLLSQEGAREGGQGAPQGWTTPEAVLAEPSWGAGGTGAEGWVSVTWGSS